MAEMITSPQKGNRRRSPKRSTRVDMTPMVDLGFLLITFFMLTTTLAEPKSLPLIMPADGAFTPVPESKSITLLVRSDRTISWYEGTGDDSAKPPQLQHSTFSAQNGIGEVIRSRQRAVAAKWGDPEELIVLIKAENGASYGNVVDALDEMKINRVARYSLADITPQEEKLLQR
ncbi:ExbD/TolR family protein [Chitinophaga rhizosphaerae]|uniref:ExbD/TolR family protein n=1 Tax=Chitinophaga rhizosphaerae TaxID=1864947 RepID=UPI000F806468|nr:biopolymer transporter ExbD [Chitinophaga rhizosphaerae]